MKQPCRFCDSLPVIDRGEIQRQKQGRRRRRRQRQRQSPQRNRTERDRDSRSAGSLAPQRGLEERLGRRLDALEAAAAAARAEAWAEFEGLRGDVAGGVRRLEARIDRIPGAAAANGGVGQDAVAGPYTTPQRVETTVAAAAAIAAPRPYEIEPAVRVVESMERGDGERRAGRGEGRLEQDGVEGRLGALERSVEWVAEAVGAKGSGPGTGEEEDRRRPQEKLKEALDRERRLRRVRTRKIETEQEVLCVVILLHFLLS